MEGGGPSLQKGNCLGKVGGGKGEFPRTIYPAAAAIPERLDSPPSAEIEWRGGSLKQGLLNALFDPRIEGG